MLEYLRMLAARNVAAIIFYSVNMYKKCICYLKILNNHLCKSLCYYSTHVYKLDIFILLLRNNLDYISNSILTKVSFIILLNITYNAI